MVGRRGLVFQSYAMNERMGRCIIDGQNALEAFLDIEVLGWGTEEGAKMMRRRALFFTVILITYYSNM